ncbi:DNA-binding transcriptional MerR regulator [Thermosporothrix hazakensis]|jgi:DNA-binding transcriptional MerR regulator|uniref:DNA-binding transcriptional MerR regulator n=2 Tax=Thermosporothrix TaxID=768650 RepID=A0A326U4R4_THEHA|nr:MerR family transcriptional regulator [Thermosporothrix hazakensis]PZW27120.1 DNA-binding transcriptional MerR regulator [Thermosporothrix hazakensis]BBH87989.1 MerR family transcriptional regulator [Thermosporothrix sp. COM3]GCE50403.1 MerR family transcriptional regulator [Thermosporothrix hazakensis]
MLKIRDFAKLAEVSMTTLRYYDEIGLLRPIHVDPDTGYRFYTMDQLPRLHRILAFKELGLGLTQIARILDEGISSETLQGMLQLRQAQLQQQIQEEREQLVRIEARLRSIEQGNSLPSYEVVLKAVKPITGVSLRLTTADLVYQAHWVDEISIMLKRYGVNPIDHLLVLHAQSEDEQPLSSVEIVAPVDPRVVNPLIIRSEGRLTRCSLPAVPYMASTLHYGPPSLVLSAYQALGTWMENNGYTIVGPRRKIRLRRGDNLDDALTEIQFPVEKVG